MKKVKEIEKSDDVKETGDVTVTPTIFTTLIDEALWAHRERSYIDMFDCVLALRYMTRDLVYVNSRSDVVGERLDVLMRWTSTLDLNDREVKIPAYNIMSAACEYSVSDGKYVIDIFDYDGKLIHMQIHKLHETYNFIGRLLLISLFEIISDSNLRLPPELVIARKSVEE